MQIKHILIGVGVLALAGIIIGISVGVTRERKEPYTYPKTPNKESESKYRWTDLDRYVWKEDDTYNWEVLNTERAYDIDAGQNYTYVLLNVTSQTWLSQEVVSCSVWWHHVGVVIPDSYEFDLETNKLSDSAMV